MTLPQSPLALALTDRYRLDREIGQGGMATVYLAEDLKHHRKVALKVLRPELAATMGPERFLREIEIAAQLQHPHILPLLDSGEAAGALFYVMPYVEGETLRDRLTRERELPVHDALRIITEIADGLAHAHAHGVVHRDIKPENILLTGRHALVADFGVAKAVSEAAGTTQLTSVGVALGTPAYMSPEQAAADPQVDHRVDIYALGVLAYELLAGRAPFTGRTPQEVLAAHITRQPEPIRNFRESVSPALEAVVMRCLEKHPADRWQTTSELVARLEPLSLSGGTASAGVVPVAAERAADARRERIPRWAGWMLGGALVAAGALAITITSKGEPPMVVGRRTAVAVGPEAERWPALSPDGRTIVYTGTSGGASRLMVAQVGGGAGIEIPTALREWQCCGALSPDGSRLLFLAATGLYVVPTLGGQARPVVSATGYSLGTSKAILLWGTWSPDGRRIAYTLRDTLYVQSPEEAERHVITTGTGIHSPAWSPDGRWIAFVLGNPAFHVVGNLAPSAVAVVQADGGTPVVVAGPGSLNTSPVWIPGRMALLFISDKDGGRDVYRSSLGGDGRPHGAPTRVTTGLAPDRIALSADGKRLAWSVFNERSNVWSIPIPGRDSASLAGAVQVTSGNQTIETLGLSPDERWLYYDSDIGGNPDIWRLPLTPAGTAGGPPEQLTTDSAADFSPTVSADGREVAFHSFQFGNRDVFVMPAAGGRPVRVTTSPEHDWNPRWSPDGQALVFDRQLNPDSALWMVRRLPDGSWGIPRALPYGPRAGRSAWSPDGRLIAFNTDSGIRVLELATGQNRLLVHDDSPEWSAWSSDSRTVYYFKADPLERFILRSVPARGGTPRTVVYPNQPERQLHHHGIAVSASRLYFPLFEQIADVWVAEVVSE